MSPDSTGDSLCIALRGKEVCEQAGSFFKLSRAGKVQARASAPVGSDDAQSTGDDARA